MMKAHCGLCSQRAKTRFSLPLPCGSLQTTREKGTGRSPRRALRGFPPPGGENERASARAAPHGDEWTALPAAGPARPACPPRPARRARPPYHREHPRALHPARRRPRRCKPLVRDRSNRRRPGPRSAGRNGRQKRRRHLSPPAAFSRLR